MRIIQSRQYIRDTKKLPADIYVRSIETVRQFVKNPRHPSLHTKRMKGTGIFELRVSKGYRITFHKQQDTIILRRVGSHDVLRKP